MKTIIYFILILAQLFQAGCAHVPASSTQTIDLARPQRFVNSEKNDLEINYLIYENSRWPLSDFFTLLRKGEYKKSLEKLDLRYYPSNTRNQILREMIETGYIPIYVRVKNNAPEAVELHEANFKLVTASATRAVLNAKDVPREIKRFNPDALVANVYNTGVVIVGFTALLALVVLVSSKGGYANFSSLPSPSSGPPEEIYNDLQHTVHLDYNKLLISQTLLQPGQSIEGLLFAFDPDASEKKNYQLSFQKSDISKSKNP